ncbi:aspartyl/glutamyl-tRNA(Asn/Gln) amidotransferase subunit C [Methanocella conradii HZ254]|uniref:Aspartyl/glutamyl-tRNA(Asn/Gln) amidotransferase subunit C n=1 Tax=Methanocella conradii (strain DSM 24694 / JCM 17849 / CGMCC 1.5162 / HZ254) TaxID=1041930 RepID=H8I9Y1_METCZ|nr:Asp-tRNA(Asn)/Glu-tRNA(Gln) amidotransferase subunit GatC [Methanocella conradii]AFD00941.1 aspartyl/glutamyl-tRNA(Asn/Gln) amidotransferase subunit C [Methanocella conradii HZ254]MDI6897711.1 Asp-tRNA(Asn)/Glu-tRNA(Gln) amidotransferase subunit GatC [Methanocella conradii]
MAISVKDVKHIASLACIDLDEAQEERFARQFNSILEYFKELDGLNTEGVEPTYHVIGLNNVFREDVVEPSLPQEEALRNAPKKEKGYFKGPRIV